MIRETTLTTTRTGPRLVHTEYALMYCLRPALRLACNAPAHVSSSRSSFIFARSSQSDQCEAGDSLMSAKSTRRDLPLSSCSSSRCLLRRRHHHKPPIVAITTTATTMTVTDTATTVDLSSAPPTAASPPTCCRLSRPAPPQRYSPAHSGSRSLSS